MLEGGRTIRRTEPKYPRLSRYLDFWFLLIIGLPLMVLTLIIVEVAFGVVYVLGFARRVKKRVNSFINKNHKNEQAKS
jgi:hypothetical protein